VNNSILKTILKIKNMNGKLIAGLLVGAAAAAGIAALFTTEKGKEIRNQLGKWCETFMEQAAEYAKNKGNAGQSHSGNQAGVNPQQA